MSTGSSKSRVIAGRPPLSGAEPAYPPVLTKADFYRRYLRGEFGNRAPTFRTLDEWVASPWRSEPAGIRSTRPGGRFAHHLEPHAVPMAYLDYLQDGFRPEELVISVSSPKGRLIQGEVQDLPGIGLSFYWTDDEDAMRPALLRSGRMAYGLEARHLLRCNLDSTSFDWLDVLRDRYPGHVIELTAWDRPWGDLPKLNTVIWEVRNY